MAVLGAVMSAFPGWFEPLTGGPEPAANTFETIERRIRGGMLLGIGVAFIARTELRPWSVTIATGVLYFALGALVARILGLILDGDDARQWLYVVVEAVMIALAGLWLWRSSAGG